MLSFGAQVKPAAFVALPIFFVLFGLVSARLLVLAARTRLIPELLLGLSTALPLAGFTFGFVGAAVGGGVPPLWVTDVGGAVCDLGFIATVGFVWRVFRKDERWAKGLSLVLSLALVSMPLFNHWANWENGVPPAMVPRSVVRTICYAWAAAESLRYAGLMRRRVRFGLAEPLLADRFQLWGSAHICFGFMLLLIMAGVKLHLSGAQFAQFFTLSGFVLGVLAVAQLMLSFFPPERYAQYIEARYRQEEAR